jgi:hypothetical protein
MLNKAEETTTMWVGDVVELEEGDVESAKEESVVGKEIGSICEAKAVETQPQKRKT